MLFEVKELEETRNRVTMSGFKGGIEERSGMGESEHVARLQELGKVEVGEGEVGSLQF